LKLADSTHRGSEPTGAPAAHPIQVFSLGALARHPAVWLVLIAAAIVGFLWFR
jgi:hypothetical protein